jgi:hypothetical protein
MWALGATGIPTCPECSEARGGSVKALVSVPGPNLDSALAPGARDCGVGRPLSGSIGKTRCEVGGATNRDNPNLELSARVY